MKPESRVQRAILSYLRTHNIVAAAVPNGAQLAGDSAARARQMSAMKADGLFPGWPDLTLIHPRLPVVGFVEVKAEGGKLNDNQRKAIEWMQHRGLPVAVCRSVEDMADTLNDWGWV